MLKMASMELDDEDDVPAPIEMAPVSGPRYPYGLCITLTDKELEKLGLDPAEAVQNVGGMVHLHAIARVTSARMEDRQDGDPCCRIELQIEDLAVESEDDENAEAEAQMPRLVYSK